MHFNNYQQAIAVLHSRSEQPTFEEIRSLVVASEPKRKVIPAWIFLSVSAPVIIVFFVILFLGSQSSIVDRHSSIVTRQSPMVLNGSADFQSSKGSSLNQQLSSPTFVSSSSQQGLRVRATSGNTASHSSESQLNSNQNKNSRTDFNPSPEQTEVTTNTPPTIDDRPSTIDAAATARSTMAPQVTMVRSFPSETILALPKGIMNSSPG
jgi:hypothetical protein